MASDHQPVAEVQSTATVLVGLLTWKSLQNAVFRCADDVEKVSLLKYIKNTPTNNAAMPVNIWCKK